MNIAEALKIAKEQGKKVRPENQNTWFIKYENGKFMQYNTYFKRCDMYCYVTTEYILKDWEVVKEKPSKETQYKIDSMKFQIARHCKNSIVNDNTNCKECIITEICAKYFNKNNETPYSNILDDWSLKDIVEAYHILKEAGEI